MYTDSLLDVDDLGGEDGEEMFRDLLVAADRYEVKRLRLPAPGDAILRAILLP
jgi:hypothetical protein